MNATSRRADAAALAGRLRAPNPARRASLANATQAIGADTRPPRGRKKRGRRALRGAARWQSRKRAFPRFPFG